MTTAIQTKQVLVVEDNPGDMQLIREIFGQVSNVMWHFVMNVVQARDFLTGRPPYLHAPRPDLIILDLNLPIFSGAALIPFVKNDPTLKDIRIVVFTSSDDDEDRRRSLRMGADEFHSKPIDLAEWGETLRKILR
jgi:two-component system response regulator